MEKRLLFPDKKEYYEIKLEGETWHQSADLESVLSTYKFYKPRHEHEITLHKATVTFEDLDDHGNPQS